jgi:energy-coupling factor transporter ATP-binding protein EcfA2
MTTTQVSIDPHVVEQTLKRLRGLGVNRAARQPLLDALEGAWKRATNLNRKIVLLGQTGVGKSALLSHLLRLAVSPPEGGPSDFSDKAVLLTGSGRSTACGLSILAGEPDRIRLKTTPITHTELVMRYQILVADLLPSPPVDSEPDEPLGPRLREEERRVLLTLADLNKRREGGKWVDPMEAVVAAFQGNPEGLLDELLTRIGRSRLRGDAEDQDLLVECPDSETGRREIKLLMERLSQGKGTPDAKVFPAHFELEVPPDRMGDWAGFQVRIEDIPGFDEAVSGRSDIVRFLGQEETLLLVCLPMGDVPGKPAQGFLEYVRFHMNLLPSRVAYEIRDRLVLAIMDHSEARFVIGAERDRDLGQELKADECRRKLKEARLEQLLHENQPVVVDANVESDLARLRQCIEGVFRAQAVEDQNSVGQCLREANAYLEQVEEEQQALTDDFFRKSEELRFRVRSAHWPDDGPVQDPLEAVYPVILETHPSTVEATCRYLGSGSRLNIYTIVEQSVLKRVDDWLAAVQAKEAAEIETLCNSARYQDVPRFAKIRVKLGRSGGAWYRQWMADFASLVTKQVKDELAPSPVWRTCQAQYGRKPNRPPYLRRIEALLRQWSLENGRVPALVDTGFDHRPRPVPATRLDTIKISGLRGIANLTLSLHPELTVLVGTNGVGKTSIITAIAACLQPLVSALQGPKPDWSFTDDDIHRVDGPYDTRQTPGALRIEYQGTLLGAAAENAALTLHMGGKPLNDPSSAVIAAASLLAEQIISWAKRVRVVPPVLPLLAWCPEDQMTGTKQDQRRDLSRQAAYQGLLSSRRSTDDFLQWFRDCEHDVLQEADPSGMTRAKAAIAGVRRAVNLALEEVGWQNLHWGFTVKEAEMDHQSKGVLPLRRLSNGQRRLIHLCGDLAYRCYKLNPHLGETACQRTPGIVLIDEVDQHMHPAWQVKIIPSLRKAFPLVQFIITTHSPVVVAACRPEQVRILREDKENAGHLTAEIPSDDPRMLTAAELLMDFFRLPSVTPNPHGNKLREAMSLATSDDRNAFEERRVQSLLSELRSADVDVSAVETEMAANEGAAKKSESVEVAP